MSMNPLDERDQRNIKKERARIGAFATRCADKSGIQPPFLAGFVPKFRLDKIMDSNGVAASGERTNEA